MENTASQRFIEIERLEQAHDGICGNPIFDEYDDLWYEIVFKKFKKSIYAWIVGAVFFCNMLIESIVEPLRKIAVYTSSTPSSLRALVTLEDLIFLGGIGIICYIIYRRYQKKKRFEQIKQIVKSNYEKNQPLGFPIELYHPIALKRLITLMKDENTESLAKAVQILQNDALSRNISLENLAPIMSLLKKGILNQKS